MPFSEKFGMSPWDGYVERRHLGVTALPRSHLPARATAIEPAALNRAAAGLETFTTLEGFGISGAGPDPSDAEAGRITSLIQVGMSLESVW